jgi:hypothetical protein
VVDNAYYILDTLYKYDMVSLLVGSRMENSITSKVVLASTRKKTGNAKEPCKRPELKVLGSFFLLSKEIASY